MTEDVLARPRFHDTPGIHDVEAVHVACNDAEVVSHQDQRRPGFINDTLHQFQQLGLNRHVQRRRRLVRNEYPGVAGEPHRNHHPLSHASAELVRIVAESTLRILARDSHPGEQADGSVSRLFLTQTPDAASAFQSTEPDRQRRIEGGHRLLEDHRDLSATDRAHGRTVGLQRQQVFSFKENGASCNFPRREDQLHDGKLADDFPQPLSPTSPMISRSFTT